MNIYSKCNLKIWSKMSKFFPEDLSLKAGSDDCVYGNRNGQRSDFIVCYKAPNCEANQGLCKTICQARQYAGMHPSCETVRLKYSLSHCTGSVFSGNSAVPSGLVHGLRIGVVTWLRAVRHVSHKKNLSYGLFLRLWKGVTVQLC